MGELFGAELWINPLSQPGFIETHFFLLSVRWKLTKLLQKAHVIFKEFAQIIYAVTQHSEALNTHAKSKARIFRSEERRVGKECRFRWRPHVSHIMGVAR